MVNSACAEKQQGEVIMKGFRAFGLVMAANFEAIIYMALAWWAGRALNEAYPRNFDWSRVTYVFGLLLIARSWYVVFRLMIRSQQSSDQEKDRSSHET